MAYEIPFHLELEGGTADQHEFQGYDGYLALAGFAWTLSLTTNYIETGRVRHRGDFAGRQSVRAKALREGSIVAQFTVLLQQDPILACILGLAGTITLNVASNFVYDLTKRVIGRNLGREQEPDTELVKELIRQRGGDVEALVAAAENSIRQSHSVIGRGATTINIYGGSQIINIYNASTRDYVMQNLEDTDIHVKDFSVAAFNANSGYGSVFDFDLGRTIPISMSKEVLVKVRSVFAWGLSEYANGTGERISVHFWRVLSMDRTPKRYVVVDADRFER
ncbi:hypothetical protein [Acidiphilium cryptum]|uniref:DUF7946 domain-containing protein n=1 Tax=Acidiphilium cryptum TaxID=524 RepID=UPI0012DCCCE0|nr:hypothetical protein [Acidiphilium cryptum]